MTKTMPLSVDDLRLVNSQRIMLTTLERERKEIKANAIEEFAERLKERMEDTRWTTIFDTSCIFENDKLDKCIKLVGEIAYEMKGGAE